MKEDFIKRFKANITKPNDTSCHIYAGSINNTGYGTIYGTYNGKKKAHLAHRLTWELVNGPIPAGNFYGTMLICHTCDNRRCVNINHLFLGTQQDNMDDMVRKHRQNKAVGTTQHLAKLDDNKILEIRQAHEEGETYADLGRFYNVHKHTIRSVCRNKTWKHVDGPIDSQNDKGMGDNHYFAKLTAKKVIEMRTKRNSGAKLTDLSEEYGVNTASVSSACNRRTWKHVK